jgi:hypothetical protein
MCADGGVLSDSALQQLEAAAYTGAVRLEGGYASWGEVSSSVSQSLSLRNSHRVRAHWCRKAKYCAPVPSGRVSTQNVHPAAGCAAVSSSLSMLLADDIAQAGRGVSCNCTL